MSRELEISVTVNGEAIRRKVDARLSLVDFLRRELGLTGTHIGCEHGVCGACTVRVDGLIQRGCLTLAAQVDGARVDTIEGLSESGAVADLQAAFLERNAVQCGYCSAGMLLTAAELLETNLDADRQAIRTQIAGNYCRCTGYQAIVDAIEAVLRQRRDRAGTA